MVNKLFDLESLPDLFSDTGIEIDFAHSTSERDQTPKKAKEIMVNPMKWKCIASKIDHHTGKSYISQGNVTERRRKTD
ncbi:hypothetical protein AVEN_91575-1 [Araneus ventricosus]|uniref:Uncharacterized protein n=1 Tax=Araneus ventricosus TaxID=182803 RepID=A0A4Y2WV66_ARAVE|nr:hypothetical protein AVEN_91575-1 [Araneus ventricosus]